MLEQGDRIRLLELARASVAGGLGRQMPDHPPDAASGSASLREPRATFATLELEGELRGCCGTIEARRPLLHDVWYNAWASAYADPRFPAVSAVELARLTFTISVLSPLEPVPARSEAELIAALAPGTHGLVLTCGAARATFLPAVWQTLPNPREFLGQLRRKAGLPASIPWSAISARRYRTETFSSDGGTALAA